MAINGNVDSGGYQGRVLRFEWGTNTTNSANNIRNIWYKITAVGGSSSYYYHHNETVDINGSRVYTGSDSHQVYTDDVLASGNIDINQNDTMTLSVEMHGGIYERNDNISKTQSWDLDEIPRYVTSWDVRFEAGLNNIKITWKTNESCSDIKFGIDEDNMTTKNVISAGGTETITDLSPNKEYTIYINFKRNDSGLYLTSNQIYKIKTQDIARITKVNDCSHGDSVAIEISNPSNSSLNLVMKIGNNQILSKAVSTGNNTISFNDTEIDNIYKLYGSNNKLTATFVLTTAGIYTNSKEVVITLTGNQKTFKLNVNNSWKRGKVWLNINGTWKRGVTWVNISGTWKRCI